MDRSQIDCIKRNSKGSYSYMRKLKKECLVGKTMIDEMNFVEELAINHSKVELNYLENGLMSSSENSIRFNKDFFSIYISLCVILFSIIGIGFSGLFGYFNNVAMKLIDAKINNGEGIEEVNQLFDQVYGLGFNGMLYAVFFLIVFISLFHFFTYITDSRRVVYLNYVRNAITLKESMLNNDDTNTI
ncbi:hypothetical protein FC756_22875 [Lysinibacillus mangiferihumi]|uniref:Uncharacterized protein n=1 Tax=Lysinibacillus mangiferihumi TaxID=1130819 RepID=A0A4U2XZX3_9BACI|nr:hypothetical protein [Lysinibacillus mangiferihumi]TKI53596.1 hypothetical protein FC756_22875 [Lysinibacillus mangiferihumi]